MQQRAVKKGQQWFHGAIGCGHRLPPALDRRAVESPMLKIEPLAQGMRTKSVLSTAPVTPASVSVAKSTFAPAPLPSAS